MARYPATLSEAFPRLLRDLSPNVQQTISKRLAKESSIYPVFLADVLSQSLPELRLEITLRVMIPASILLQLAHDPDPAVRRAVAQRPDIPTFLAEKLATAPDAHVR
ncbi:MAG: hypothetical protein RBG13Loki_3201 [Promethearchaeota archaeon CR_4]|nr:MAG: hypothetical protein RBG13Loki_3201 [Candidatus Lokiarchaeota archaeon CR_4]